MIFEVALLLAVQQQPVPRPPTASYLFFVASEGLDQVALVRFGPTGLRIEHRTPIRLSTADSTGPRSIDVAPGGHDYYVVTAGGFPNGELLKMRIAADSAASAGAADTLRGREPLGPFPGALQVTPDGEYALVTNATPDGDRQPSWLSVVYLKSMVEVERIATCAAPRGGQLTADGTRHYFACLADDRLVEVDVRTMKVARQLALPAAGDRRCQPDAVALASDASHLYVACRRSNEVIEVDVNGWSVTRHLVVGAGPGDLALTHDGKLLVTTNVPGQSVSLVDVVSGQELTRLFPARHVPAALVIRPYDRDLFVEMAAQIAAARRTPVGVVITPDDRYAFVSVTGSGGDPGSVEVIDLAARAIVATVDVGSGAGGISFWKMERGP